MTPTESGYFLSQKFAKPELQVSRHEPHSCPGARDGTGKGGRHANTKPASWCFSTPENAPSSPLLRALAQQTHRLCHEEHPLIRFNHARSTPTGKGGPHTAFPQRPMGKALPLLPQAHSPPQPPHPKNRLGTAVTWRCVSSPNSAEISPPHSGRVK